MNRPARIAAAGLALYGTPGRAARYADKAAKVVDALLPQIVSVEDLETLRGMSLLLGDDGRGLGWVHVYEYSSAGLFDLNRQTYVAASALLVHGPLTVIWSPTP